ncbi:hypothetical protein [Streptomyces olivaceiscleroticus]|uniref:Uncharacterized protein n=1 Tax=Streptomyces olivaceiscleroticus TaxID=68245 RepID=A0ABN0ZKS8_9ACTN
MALPQAEIPAGANEEGRLNEGLESLPKITRLNRRLYALVFYILGAALLLLVLGWVLLTAIGRPVPDGIPVIIATIVGALVGVIATDTST